MWVFNRMNIQRETAEKPEDNLREGQFKKAVSNNSSL